MILWLAKFAFSAECFRWDLTNRELEIKEFDDFETHLDFKRDLTGSLKRISWMISSGRSKISPKDWVWNWRWVVALVFFNWLFADESEQICSHLHFFLCLNWGWEREKKWRAKTTVDNFKKRTQDRKLSVKNYRVVWTIHKCWDENNNKKEEKK